MRKVLDIFVWVILIGLMIFAMGWGKSKLDQTLCEDIQMDISHINNNYFIDSKDLERLIRASGDTLIGTKHYEIDSYKLEKLIKENPYIKSAEVYVDLKGTVYIEVTQRNPILRIVNFNGESYYLDENGKIMPLSPKYSARVLVANGRIWEPKELRAKLMNSEETYSNILIDRLYGLADFIRNDKFWKSQITQIYIKEDGDIELIPRVGRHVILFGKIENTDEKFMKLWMFYQKGLNNIGWNKYDEINLKYKNQIVCTKK